MNKAERYHLAHTVLADLAALDPYDAEAFSTALGHLDARRLAAMGRETRIPPQSVTAQMLGYERPMDEAKTNDDPNFTRTT